MTVATTTNKAIFTGNGSTTVFPFTFGTLPSGDLLVELYDLNSQVIPQTEITHYTVQGKGEEDGGSVTFLVAPPLNYKVLIRRLVPFTQPTDLKNQGSFYPRTHERAFDRGAMWAQQLNEVDQRAMTLPAVVTGVSTELPIPQPTTLFGWNPAGTGIQNYPLSTIATNIVYGNKVYQTFNGTGAQVNFLLSQDPGSLGNLDVSIDGVTQVPVTDYSYATTTLTFTTAPANGAVILVRYDIALPIGTATADNVTYTPPSTGIVGSVRSFLDALWSTGSNLGAALIRYIHSGAGAVARKLQDKINDGPPSLKDFGAVGDGITNDTAAVTAAVAHMAATGQGVAVTPGTYMCDPFSIETQFYDLQATLTGSDRERCIIKRRTAGAGAFVTLGDPLATVYQSGVNFDGITIDGGATTNGPALECYDVVRTSFHTCRFKGGSDAIRLYGGISVVFRDCTADMALRGLKASKFTSLAGGGYPNLISWTGGEIVDNAEWGVHFDHGNMLLLSHADIEGNGTTLAATEGGVYIGPNIGEAVFASDPSTQGVVISGCWIEANKGVAGVLLESGRNAIENTWFFTQATNCTNDIKVTGGRYVLDNVKMSFAKAANLLETSGVQAGNLVANTVASGLSVDGVKTMIINGTSAPFIQYNGGRSMITGGITAPFTQVGSDSSDVNPSIVFPTAFKTGTTPNIRLTVISNSAGTIDAPEAYNVTATGFTIRKKSYNGAIGTANYQVDWQATGEARNT